MASILKFALIIELVCTVLVTLIYVVQFQPLHNFLDITPAIAGYKERHTSCDARTCGALHDLTEDYSYGPPDTDMLEELRSCGWQPRLLSRAVRRDNDTTVNASASLVVANVVHYILFKKTNSTKNYKFLFHYYLSFRSVHQFIRPRYIFLHGDLIPEGEWWQRTLQEVDNLYHVYSEKPTKIHDKVIGWVEHASDIKRLTLLIDFGGIYLDTDVLILKSFDPLRGHDLVIARDSDRSIANGIMIARKGALFLRLWLESYRNYRPRSWGGNSVRFSNLLQKLYPHLVYVELHRLLKYGMLECMYGFTKKKHCFDWSKSLSMHIYGEKIYTLPETPEQLKGFDSAIGQMMRYIYFGSPDLLPISGERFTAKKIK